MYRYFNRLLDKYDLPIYPIALLSYDTPLKAAPNSYTVAFPKRKVLQFDYDVVQLNRLNWQDFVDKPSPIISALMAKMQIAEEDRPRAKVACLKMMVGLKLDEEQKLLISDFIGTYLDLNAAEEAEYQRQLAEELPEEEEEQVMTLMNGWVRQGYNKGITEGKSETLLKLITLKVGPVSPKVEEQVQALPVEALDDLTAAVLNFKTEDDVTRWLAEHSKN